MSEFNLNYMFKFFFVIVAVIFFVGAIAAYAQTEIQTFLHKQDIDSQKLCKVGKSSNLKYSKIIDYQRYRKSSSIFCIFSDSQENSRLTLNLIGDDWQIVTNEKLNQERAFYWPIYL
jgi:hypothetical protein